MGRSGQASTGAVLDFVKAGRLYRQLQLYSYCIAWDTARPLCSTCRCCGDTSLKAHVCTRFDATSAVESKQRAQRRQEVACMVHGQEALEARGQQAHVWASDAQSFTLHCQHFSRQALLPWRTHQQLLQGGIPQASPVHNIPHPLLHLSHARIRVGGDP